MKRGLLNVVCLLLTTSAIAWNVKGDKIKTEWAEKVTPGNVWQNYPRPQLKRTAWVNLNGLWEYSVTNLSVQKKSVKYEDKILVPFAIESALSGVAKTFTPEDKLWYRRELSVNSDLKGKQTILHFGAVDYECTVWVNNKEVGSHKGGNNPFSFDITKFLNPKGKQILELSVTDPTDKETITRGKQQLNQFGIWYTPVSGIWQTVWMESVNATHIANILPESDIAKNTVNLNFDYSNITGDESLNIKVFDNLKVIATVNQKVANTVSLKIPNPILWTPSTAKLYTFEVELTKKNVVVDKVSSYFAMRKVSMTKDEAGYNRISLNNKPIFQYGTLDQGWWPDGLLTPPSPEAMLWDMVQLKNMGFNTIRKHIKVEPALYYYYADSLGLMLWQDMPSAFATSRKKEEHIQANATEDWNAPAAVVNQWKYEINGMIDVLRFFPCITTWVVFNEGWGQHNTTEMVEMVKQKDKSRIVNGVSGWTDRNAGDVLDVHNYPMVSIIEPAHNNNRISVLGEFGGLGMPVKDHLWNPEMKNWGYKNIDKGVDLVNDYGRLVYDLETLIAQGAAAAIYTQTTDVEGEVNGLITYDRKVTKMPVPLLHQIHSRLYNITPKKATVLIANVQGGKKQKTTLQINGITKEMQTPLELTGDAIVRCTQTFNVENDFNYLSVWLKMNGKTKIWINNNLVFNQSVNNTRQYNQMNISDYVSLLKHGDNQLCIEVTTGKSAKMDFDYSLTAF